jgi:hypothetical protein
VCTLTLQIDGSILVSFLRIQHWYKDMRHGNDVKDEEGASAFALVNKATGQAIKHSHGRSHPVGQPAYY